MRVADILSDLAWLAAAECGEKCGGRSAQQPRAVAPGQRVHVDGVLMLMATYVVHGNGRLNETDRRDHMLHSVARVREA